MVLVKERTNTVRQKEHSARTNVTWQAIEGTPDFETADGRFVAIYQHSFGGFASYRTYPADILHKKRTMINTLSVGGLPAVL